VDVPELAAKKHVSEEEAGREARYLAFNKKVKQIHEYGKDISQIKIAVAHHQDDQAETVLFRLARGTGLSGLCGIRPINGHIIRPMLALTKQEIYDILKENDLSFRVDATNMEDSYARNRIRNKVLPYLEENICHNAGAHIAETAAMLAEAETYISKEAGKKLLTCVIRDDNGYRYSIQKELFLQEDIILQKYMILKIFHELTEGRKDITQVHVQDVLNLFQKQVGRKIDLPYDLCARVCYGKVIIEKKNTYIRQNCIYENESSSYQNKNKNNSPKILEPEVQYELEGVGILRCSVLKREEFFTEKTELIPEKTYTKWFDYDKILGSLSLRNKEEGDFLVFNEQMSKKTLKDYMKQEKIPRELRDTIYVLAEGNHILWVIGGRISHYYKVTKDTKRILQVQVTGGITNG